MENGDSSSIGIVTGDRFCVGCGYNVRTLRWSGKCPECGRSVWDSVQKALRLADRMWLRKMQWALWLLAVSVLLMAVTLCLAHGLQGARWVVAPYLLMPAGSKLSLERAGYFNQEPTARWCFLSAVFVQTAALLL